MQKFAVLGHPINHSFSPVMHMASFQSIGFDGEYTRIDVPPETLPKALEELANEGYTGVNLTIPHKQLAVPLMSELSKEARLLGAVNTVLFKDGKMIGHNTDAPGFMTAAHTELEFTPEGAKVAVIGCGGAGRAIALTLAMHGVASLGLIDIDATRVQSLCKEIEATFHIPCHAIEKEAIGTVDFIAQCSPSGLAVCPAPALTRDQMRSGQKLYDIVIPPKTPVTPTMIEAQALGNKCCNGIPMLVEQGALSFEFWTGLKPDRQAMHQAIIERFAHHE